MKHDWGRGEVRVEFWWGNLREGDYLQDPSVDERIILKCVLGKLVGVMD